MYLDKRYRVVFVFKNYMSRAEAADVKRQHRTCLVVNTENIIVIVDWWHNCCFWMINNQLDRIIMINDLKALR